MFIMLIVQKALIFIVLFNFYYNPGRERFFNSASQKRKTKPQKE